MSTYEQGWVKLLLPVRKWNAIKKDVKLRLDSSIVVQTGIYASETWKQPNN